MSDQPHCAFCADRCPSDPDAAGRPVCPVCQAVADGRETRRTPTGVQSGANARRAPRTCARCGQPAQAEWSFCLHCQAALEGMRRRLMHLTYPERLPVWKWHETRAVLQGCGMFGVGLIGLACALGAALSRNPLAAAGLLALGLFLAVVLVVAGLKSPQQSAPIARQAAAVLDRALATIGLIVIVAVGLAVAAAVCLVLVVCAAGRTAF